MRRRGPKGAPPTFHAIYLALGEATFAEASIRSVYDSVVGITLFTGHDRDWHGRERTPDCLVEDVLSRRYDPERKINLIVASETSDGRSRNRAMDFADPPLASRAVKPMYAEDRDPDRPDYFLIVDADEVWERRHLEGLREWASRDRLPTYHVACLRYFRTWTTRIDGFEYTPVLYRGDMRIQYLRRRQARLWRRGLASLPGIPRSVRERLREAGFVPPDVAVFHHGSYVGSRERIIAKIQTWGHAHEVRPNWLENYYDAWTPEMTDFHPVHGPEFPRAHTVPLDDLPAEIKEFPWPPGYLDNARGPVSPP